MGKSKGGSAKVGNKFFQGKDGFQRMNYLYQAAHVLLAQTQSCTDVSAYYGNSMFQVAQKSVLKIEPNIKRDICKGCGTLLKPGITVKVRVRVGNMIFTCLRCGTMKRFPTKRGFKLWIEKDEAILELIEVPSCNNLSTDSLDRKNEFKVPLEFKKDLISVPGLATYTQKNVCSESSKSSEFQVSQV